MPDFFYETQAGRAPVCGVDEAGRGPLAGPVVAAAVILDRNSVPPGINDSKKILRAARTKLYAEIIACAQVGVGVASVEEIDNINILNASLLAMRRAVAALPIPPRHALIDGNRPPDLPCGLTCIVEGDGKSLSIAAASIIAKVTRDRYMSELAAQYPHYGFEKHSGYGTKYHQEALAAHGVTPHHRRSFAPIRLLLEKEKIRA